MWSLNGKRISPEDVKQLKCISVIILTTKMLVWNQYILSNVINETLLKKTKQNKYKPTPSGMLSLPANLLCLLNYMLQILQILKYPSNRRKQFKRNYFRYLTLLWLWTCLDDFQRLSNTVQYKNHASPFFSKDE